MKSYLTRSASPASTGDTIKISKREVERVVAVEVQSVMKKKENELDALINSIQQQLDQGLSSDSSMKLLQNRMMLVSQRAEKALAHLNEMPTSSFQMPSSSSQMPTSSFQMPTTSSQCSTPPLQALTPPLADSPVVDSHLEVKNVRTLSEKDPGVTEFMENTKKEFARLRAENAAFKAALEDIRDRATPSPTTLRRQPGVIEGLAKLMHIKKEPVDPAEEMNPSTTVPVPVPPVKRVKEECPSSEADRITKRIKSEPVQLTHPPLPQLPVPICIPSEAARYNHPPKLKVDLALITNPAPQLSVVWSLAENDPNAPPMDTYSVFFTAEQRLGCGVFGEWQNLTEHPAGPLPMLALIPKYNPGHKICVTVVGKDKFGRYGPFSKVACAYS
uniref:Activating transcription factor 7-interacting protein Fn3 domain-containing protein n=1 Tax=Neogobius melanostomus TaxID=47308 RepID=A0A8C6WTW1_9GOBI